MDSKKTGSITMKKEFGDLFIILFEEEHVKVKELIVEAGKGMSFQKHFKRNEIWLVSKGSCIVNFSNNNPDFKEKTQLNKFDHFFSSHWKMASNNKSF